MRRKIKQISLILFFIIVILFPLSTDARSGCCSWHGGVCGCSCCDGTPLSATCAPYYPHCNSPIITTTTTKIIPPTTTTTTLPPPTTTTTTVPPTTTTTTTAKRIVPIIQILPKSKESEIEIPEVKIETNNELESQQSLELLTAEKLTAQVYKKDKGISVWLWIIGLGIIGCIFIFLKGKK